MLLNAGSPAYLVRSIDKGHTWKTVYANTNPAIFFDSMKFMDEKNGVAVGDPIDGRFTIISTNDGGESWNMMEEGNLPIALQDEACFASSNTCFDLSGKNTWIATGGAHARILHSDDGGNSWDATTSTLPSGEALTGIFSLDFYDEINGVIGGGNYDKPESEVFTYSITHNGGKTWIAGKDPLPFVSCIQFQPNSRGKNLMAACLPGIYRSTDGGMHWKKLSEANRYYTFQFAPSRKVAWFGGAEGRILRISL